MAVLTLSLSPPPLAYVTAELRAGAQDRLRDLNGRLRGFEEGA